MQGGGPAFRRNLRRGCVIYEINGAAIQETDDVDTAFRSVEGGDIVSLVASCNGATGIYNVRVPR